MEIICVTIFLVILFSTEDCRACFSHNESSDAGSFISNTPFYKECYCRDSTTPEDSVTRLKWLDIYNQEIGPMGPGTRPKVYTEMNKYSLSLHIPSLSTSLSGKYQCVMYHDDGRRHVYAYQVDVYDQLYFYNTDKVQYLTKGRSSLITCQARGRTPPVIIWNKVNDVENRNMDQGDMTEISADDKYNITDEGVIVNNVTNDDGGTYKCRATVYETGEDVETYIKVEVMTAPVIDANDNNIYTVIEGSDLSVECNAEGFPLPTYSWHKKIQAAADGAEQNNTWRQELNTIIFESIEPEDHGNYECIAQNKAGVATRIVSIIVLTPPIITHFENVTAAEGSTEHIICRASGIPAPTVNISFVSDSTEDDLSVTWSRNISENETEINLTFNKVRRSHAGLYSCDAFNEVNATVEAAYLSVLYKPYFDEIEETVWAWNENPINLTCDHHSQPPGEVEWRYQGSPNHILTYETDVNRIILMIPKSDRNLYLPLKDNIQFGRYLCSAKNDFGEATKVFNVKEGVTPMPINNVTIIDVKAASATFLIESPRNAGPPIIGVFAEYDEADNYKVTDIHVNRTWAVSQEYKLDKLKPGTNYSIKFAAINKVGTGRFSDMIEFDTPEKSVPDPPTKLESNSTQTSNGDVVLKLKEPEDNGGDPIDYYIVKYCPVQNKGDEPEESTCKELKVPPTTELQLNDLDYNTSYYLKLVAHNSEGNSTPTETYFKIMMTGTPPSEEPVLSGGAIIGLAVVMVVLGILLLDVLLFLTKRQGMIANCCCKKSKKKKETSVQARDKKGLLKDNGESVASDTLKRADNGHKEFEYNKTTGIITGKHSAV